MAEAADGKSGCDMKRFNRAILVIVFFGMFLGLPAIAELKKEPREAETGEYALFDPFTLEAIEASRASASNTVESSFATGTMAAEVEDQNVTGSRIRIPCRLPLRSPYQPPLVEVR